MEEKINNNQPRFGFPKILVRLDCGQLRHTNNKKGNNIRGYLNLNPSNLYLFVFYWWWVTGNATDAKRFYVEEEVVGVEPFDKDDERNVQTAGGGASVHSLLYILAARERLRGWTVQVRTELGLDRRKQQQESLRYIYMYLSLTDVLFTKVGRGGERPFSSW